MDFTPLSVAGAFIIKAPAFEDERGFFRRSFCAAKFRAAGLNPVVAQGNVSENHRRGTLRGFHWQDAPHGEDKTLSCLRGCAFFRVLDLRPESRTYLQSATAVVGERNRHSLHVPCGCALAFLALADNTVLHYYVSKPFAPDHYRGLRHDDPYFNFFWPRPGVLCVSERDRGWPDFVPAPALAPVAERGGVPCASS